MSLCVFFKGLKKTNLTSRAKVLSIWIRPCCESLVSNGLAKVHSRSPLAWTVTLWTRSVSFSKNSLLYLSWKETKLTMQRDLMLIEIQGHINFYQKNSSHICLVATCKVTTVSNKITFECKLVHECLVVAWHNGPSSTLSFQQHHNSTQGGSDTKNELQAWSNWKYKWVLPRCVRASLAVLSIFTTNSIKNVSKKNEISRKVNTKKRNKCHTAVFWLFSLN